LLSSIARSVGSQTVFAALAALFSATVCVASPIPIGPIFLLTENASFQTNVTGALTTVDFQSNGNGGYDTVINRLNPHSGTVSGTPEPINIELVALNLVSVNPIQVGTSFFDVFMTIGGPSLGLAQISHDNPDDGTPAPEGLFLIDILDVNYMLTFVEVGNPGNVLAPEFRNAGLTMSFPVGWSHEAGPLVFTDGLMGVTGTMTLEGRSETWNLTNAPVPEPGSLTLLATGALALLAGIRRRR
jgi:hypothetical protein